MSKGKGWDLTSLHSLEGAAEWIRKNSGALLVLVVRAEDIAFAVDAQIAPADARVMVELVMPDVQRRLEQQRMAARDLAAEKKRQGR
jgi:hypothetical protein